MARAEYAIANCVNTGQIACHVCNAIELKLKSKRASQSETGIWMEELRAFKNKINWKNSRNLTTFVYVHSFFMLSSPVDRAAAHVHISFQSQAHCVRCKCAFVLCTQLPHRSISDMLFWKVSPSCPQSQYCRNGPFIVFRSRYTERIICRMSRDVIAANLVRLANGTQCNLANSTLWDRERIFSLTLNMIA